MRTLALLFVGFAACGGSSKPGTVGNFPGGGGPAGPAPTVAWSGGAPIDGGEMSSTGMPAVSDDGSRVLLAWVKGDGGRGYPNLRLLVVDRADRVLDTRVVLDADQIDDGTPAVDVAPFNAFLAESNATHRWRPLAVATVDEGQAQGDDMFPRAQSARLGDLAVRLDDQAHLVIEQAGKVVVDTVETGWLAADRPMYPGAAPDEVCTNPIYLGSVHADAARRLAVIGVEYRGNDTCWEPSGEYHVVAW